jgi:hypothetical protein
VEVNDGAHFVSAAFQGKRRMDVDDETGVGTEKVLSVITVCGCGHIVEHFLDE